MAIVYEFNESGFYTYLQLLNNTLMMSARGRKFHMHGLVTQSISDVCFSIQLLIGWNPIEWGRFLSDNGA